MSEQNVLAEIKTDVKWLVKAETDARQWREDIEKHLAKINSKVQTHQTTLYGADNNDGLCGSHDEFRKEYYAFRKIVFLIIGILIGSGVLSVTAYEVISRLN